MLVEGVESEEEREEEAARPQFKVACLEKREEEAEEREGEKEEEGEGEEEQRNGEDDLTSLALQRSICAKNAQRCARRIFCEPVRTHCALKFSFHALQQPTWYVNFSPSQQK